MAAPSLARYAWLSVLAALATMALKAEAYLVTGSVGLLSDAAESVVNLVAAFFTLAMLSVADRPADSGHPFGHGKAEYFASAFEGLLILVAGGGIAWAAWERFQEGTSLARLDLGMAISAGAAAINLAVALVLLRAGRRHHSIALEADARHLLSDVWTTVAILAALGGVLLTGWQILDPIAAGLAAAQIGWSGFGLVRRSVTGLLDSAVPAAEQARIDAILDRYRAEGVQFHELRTRVSGRHRFMTVHVLVPGTLSVQDGHDLVERIEADLRESVPNLAVLTHLEPLEDRASFAHEGLDEPPASAPSKRMRPGGASFLVGAALLVLGTAGSLLLSDFYADAALAVSLVGLILSLGGQRRLDRGVS